jgi:NTE family protein
MRPLNDPNCKIGLALSGGGFRASLFHLGALRRLNEAGLLSRTSVISSVSGGSILAGLLAVKWGNLTVDPATGRFLNFEAEVEKPMTHYCGENLRNAVIVGDRLNPLNWPKLFRDDFSLTNILAQHYDRDLLGGAKLDVLKKVEEAGGPRFVICATSMDSGVLFRFEPNRIGDWIRGYIAPPDWTLGTAVAASSAFPVAFPPLELTFPEVEWKHGDCADAGLLESLRSRAALTDGGVYDNLGLEPVWKPQSGFDVVFCSDGGAPFSATANPDGALLARLKRANDVIDRANRAQRKQRLIDYFQQEAAPYAGSYWGIGTDIDNYPLTPKAQGYRGELLARIASIRTDLNVFTPVEQGVLRNHGWLLAGAALAAHLKVETSVALAPDPDLLNPETATAKLPD